jgi:phage-related holin
MNWETIRNVLARLTECFSGKMIIAGILAAATHKYSVLVCCFCILLYLDILTKWIAISYAYLVEQGNEDPAFFDAVKGINSARKARKINSEEMRKRGVSKLFVYSICILMAAICDLMSYENNVTPQIVQVVSGYLAMNETLSVIENLGDAGVKSMARLYELLKRRGK